MQYFSSVAWLIFSIAAALFAGCSAYQNYGVFFEMVDLLTNIVSILTGVSLAVLAVLASPIVVTPSKVRDVDEAKRVESVLADDDHLFSNGQVFMFLLFLGSLALLFIFKWAFISVNLTTSGVSGAMVPRAVDNLWIEILAGISAFVGVFSFLWAARLPAMLIRSSRQRRDWT